MDIKFSNKSDLDALYAKSRLRANNEPNQDSYNAAWLHGYADAIKDIAAGCSAIDVVDAYNRSCWKEDAVKHLGLFFGIDPDDIEADPAAAQACADQMGASFDELINDSGDYYIIDKLVVKFIELKNDDVAVSDTFQTTLLSVLNPQVPSKHCLEQYKECPLRP